MERCETVVARRFLKAFSTSLLKTALRAFKDKTTGSKKELAERLAENGTNETDDEDGNSDSE
jgi:hypothetical protein